MTESVIDISGISIGHYTDTASGTGCTVILCPDGAVPGVDVRGSAPGTRETDLMRTGHMIRHIHGLVLSGGSAFGLESASGVMRYLEENNIGYKVANSVVPIVPAAIIFDLGFIDNKIRPGIAEGYLAAKNATIGTVQEGNVGAGTGATIGKAMGIKNATKGGLGTYCMTVAGVKIAAIAVANPFGDVVDPETGIIIAGARGKHNEFINTSNYLLQDSAVKSETDLSNTTLAVVITDADLTKEEANKLSQNGQNGLSLAIRPAHTTGDGDVVFALATGKSKLKPDMRQLGIAASKTVYKAIIQAVRSAESLGGIPSANEIGQI